MYIMLQFSLNEPATAITDLFGSGVHALPFHAIGSSVRFRHSPDCLHDAHLEWCLSCVFLRSVFGCWVEQILQRPLVITNCELCCKSQRSCIL